MGISDFFFIFFSCTIKPDLSLLSVSKISYPDLIEKYNSCEGKGYVDSQGDVVGNYTFHLNLKGIVLLLNFPILWAGKTILMWVDPKNLLFVI